MSGDGKEQGKAGKEDRKREKILKAHEMVDSVSDKGQGEDVQVVTSATIKDQNASIEDILNQIKWILKKSGKPLSAEDICKRISCKEKEFTVVQVNKLMRSLKTFTPLKREVVEGTPYFSLLEKD